MTQSTNPLISVIMPVKNGAEYLTTAVQSVLLQSVREFEFLIINDYSTDDTERILASIEDPRVRVVNNPGPRGFATALNYGLELAKGKYIARMDCDDFCYAHRFKEQIEFFKAHPHVDICGTWAALIDHAGNRCGSLRPATSVRDIRKFIWRRCPLIHPTVFFSPSIRQDLYYQDTLSGSHDYELWWRLVSQGAILENIPRILLCYRLHGGTMSSLLYKEMGQESFTLFLRYTPQFECNFDEYQSLIGLRAKIGILSRFRALRNLKSLYNFSNRFLLIDSLKYVLLRLVSLIGLNLRDPRWSRYRSKNVK